MCLEHGLGGPWTADRGLSHAGGVWGIGWWLAWRLGMEAFSPTAALLAGGQKLMFLGWSPDIYRG